MVGLSAEGKRRKSLECYEYTSQGPGPTIVVVQDVDAQPGAGAWWGEVHTALHQGLTESDELRSVGGQPTGTEWV